jgi:putative salt-induced outer membrane protein YdiY
MQCRLTLATAALFMFVSSSAAAQVSDEAEIRARERTLVDAMHRRNRAQLEQLLAPDYVLRAVPDIDRETWIRNAITLCWGDRSDIDAFHARQHGGVVIASFELTFYVDPASCRPAVLRSLITDVWIRHPDGWRLQIRHSGPPPSATAGVASQYGIVPLPPPAWDVSGELSLVATGGNTSTRTMGLGGNMIHRTEATNTRASIAFLTSEVESVTKARSLAMQLRQGLRVTPRTELFGRGLYARDRFAGIADRTTAEGGMAYTARLPRRQAITSEGSIGLTVEQRLDATRLRFANGTGTVKYVWTVLPGTELTEDIGVTTDLEAARDWRGTSRTAVGVTLTRLVSLKASHAIEHRNLPVAGFGPTDMRTAAALVLSWQGRPNPR